MTPKEAARLLREFDRGAPLRQQVVAERFGDDVAAEVVPAARLEYAALIEELPARRAGNPSTAFLSAGYLALAYYKVLSARGYKLEEIGPLSVEVTDRETGEVRLYTEPAADTSAFPDSRGHEGPQASPP